MTQKMLITVVFAFALSMDLMDATIVNVAISAIGHDLSVSAIDLQGVVTAYTVALAACIPASGWLGDRFGAKRIFLLALAVFTGGSAMCAAAPSAISLISARALQGIGGGLMTPVGLTMLMRAFPATERAAASAVLTVPVAISPAIGPLLGGFLVEQLSWHWIFAINLPIGLVCLLLAWLGLEEHHEGTHLRFDSVGFLLSVLGFAFLIYGLSVLADDLSQARRSVPMPAGVGVVLLIIFMFWERRVRNPLLDIGLLRARALSISSSVMFFAAGAFGGTLFLLPLMLQSRLGFSPIQAGWVTFAHALGIITAMSFASRLYRRFGARIVLTLGMAITGVATVEIATCVSSAGLVGFAAMMLVAGIGFGLTIVPLQTLPFAGLDEKDMGQASALFNTARQVALACGVAVTAALLAWRSTSYPPADAIQAYRDVFVVSAVLAAAGAIVAFIGVPRAEPNPQGPAA